MTIMATHFAIVLGAWRLRIRVDIDEPREAELQDERVPATAHGPAPAATAQAATHATWGRG